PFVLIPVGILVFRLVRYLLRLYKARRHGYGEDFIKDPLSELGLTVNRSYGELHDIRKIRKEKARLAKLKKKQELLRDKKKAQEADAQGGNKAARLPALAENYLIDIRRKTRKTWTDTLSPSALRQWLTTSRWGRVWMVFQVLCTLVAIINYVLLTYSIQRKDRRLIKALDIGLASVFLLDYVLGFYIAEDKLRFYFNFGSLIDLMSIVPPFVYVFVSDTSAYVWFLGLLRILRASRILRTYRLLSFSESEVKREIIIICLTFMNFVFLAASVINALETLELDYKQPPSLLKWHDSLYYIFVTFSTIGFGDLTPSSIPSRVVVMLLIVFVIVFVPLQTTRLTELYSMSSPFQRARYTDQGHRQNHVILSGQVNYTVIIDFCREYFATDLGGHVVILNPHEPTLEIKRLLRHPFYRSRVYYLSGTPLSLPDLRRAGASSATGMFLLNIDDSAKMTADEGEDEQLRVTRGADADILMQALVSKTNFPDLGIFAEVQDIRSQDLAPHCGINRVLCLDEIKMSIIARNTVVPGVLTLILNLVHTYHTNDDMNIDGQFKREYKRGSENQIYAFKLPFGLVGFRYADVVRILFCGYEAILFGVILATPDGATQFAVDEKICFNPGKNYLMADGDVVFCIVNGQESDIIRIIYDFRENPDPDDIPRSLYGILKRARSISAELQLLRAGTVAKVETNLTNPLNVVPYKNAAYGASKGFPQSGILNEVVQPIVNHILICGNVTARAIRHFVRSVRGFAMSAEIGEIALSPIVIMLEKIAETMGEEENGIWPDIFQYPKVYVLRGTPLKRTSLVKAGIASASRVIIFRSGVGGSSEGGANLDVTQALADANSIFIVKMIQEEWSHVPYMIELVNGANVKFFSSRFAKRKLEAEGSPTGASAGSPAKANVTLNNCLDNYALSINDRLALYRTLRTQRESNNIIKNLIEFAFSSPHENTQEPKTVEKRRGPLKKSQFKALASWPPSRKNVKQDDGKHGPLSVRGAQMGTSSAPVDEEKGIGADEKIVSIDPASDESDLEEADYPSDIADSDNDDGDHEHRDLPHNRTGRRTNAARSGVGFTTAYLQSLEEQAELNATGLVPFPVHHFDRHFAAGLVAPLGFMHSLLCQAYFRPYIINIVRQLSNSIVRIAVSSSLDGRRYTEGVEVMLDEGYVVIGMYRFPRKGEPSGTNKGGSPLAASYTDFLSTPHATGRDGNRLPYVYTNPLSTDTIHSEDYFFALKYM
ncbi:hypothetical protein BJ742DRAFT_897190, partial [Cladochytrium replicatum]